MQRIPALVTLRSVREKDGLTSPMLAEKIAERGIKVDPDHILSVELGHKGASNALLVAWANVLQINAKDIVLAAGVREMVAEADRDGESGAAA